jgi:hypothetical protein
MSQGLSNRGQVPGGVGGLIALLVLIAIGAIVLYEVTGALDVEDDRTSTTNQLTNTTFTDNSDGWDNIVEGNSENVETDWLAGGYVYAYANDNDAVVDNGIWYQSTTVTSLRDGVSSATLSFEWRVTDNTNAASIFVVAQLCDGTDNTTWYSDNVTQENNATWTAVENDVSDNITAAGTYTLYLRAEMIGKQGVAPDNIYVEFDDANLAIVTYSAGYSENAIIDVEDKGSTVLDLLTILGIVLVAAIIIGTVIRSIGGIGGTRGRPTAMR